MTALLLWWLMLISQENLAARGSAAPLGLQEDQGRAGWLSSGKARADSRRLVLQQLMAREGIFLWASEPSPKQWMNSLRLQPGLMRRLRKCTRGPRGREGPSFAEEV